MTKNGLYLCSFMLHYFLENKYSYTLFTLWMTSHLSEHLLASEMGSEWRHWRQRSCKQHGNQVIYFIMFITATAFWGVCWANACPEPVKNYQSDKGTCQGFHLNQVVMNVLYLCKDYLSRMIRRSSSWAKCQGHRSYVKAIKVKNV